MIKYLLLATHLFIHFTVFSQDEVTLKCSREPSSNDILGSISDSKSRGWSYWAETSDEFNGSVLDTSKWEIVGHGSFFCHGMSTYAYFKDDPDLVHVSNGRLLLKAKEDSPQICIFDTGSDALNYSSGYVQSKEMYHGGPYFRFGMIQVKCKIPFERTLEPSIWTTGRGTVNGIYRYDEMEIYEKINARFWDSVFRQTLWRWFYDPPADTLNAKAVECRDLVYPANYTSIDFVVSVEWLPAEVNFYVNGHCSNTFKYTTNSNWISPWYARTHSEFTCTDFTNACRQGIQLSLSLAGPHPVDLSQGFEIDWVRCFKLIQGTQSYWPAVVQLSDNELSKVHQDIILGGTGHDGNVPAYSDITLWASNSITIDAGFSLPANQTFEIRRIDTDPDLLFPISGGIETE